MCALKFQPCNPCCNNAKNPTVCTRWCTIPLASGAYHIISTSGTPIPSGQPVDTGVYVFDGVAGSGGCFKLFGVHPNFIYGITVDTSGLNAPSGGIDMSLPLSGLPLDLGFFSGIFIAGSSVATAYTVTFGTNNIADSSKYRCCSPCLLRRDVNSYTVNASFWPSGIPNLDQSYGASGMGYDSNGTYFNIGSHHTQTYSWISGINIPLTLHSSGTAYVPYIGPSGNNAGTGYYDRFESDYFLIGSALFSDVTWEYHDATTNSGLIYNDGCFNYNFSEPRKTQDASNNVAATFYGSFEFACIPAILGIPAGTYLQLKISAVETRTNTLINVNQFTTWIYTTCPPDGACPNPSGAGFHNCTPGQQVITGISDATTSSGVTTTQSLLDPFHNNYINGAFGELASGYICEPLDYHYSALGGILGAAVGIGFSVETMAGTG